jgi:GT2 family glycosyltransferase
MDTVSVLILSLNKRPYTRACLDSLLDSRDVALDVVVVDNGSTDGSPDLLAAMEHEFARRGHSLRWRANCRNVGCCTGRNQALEMASGEYCLFMDNDVMVADADWAGGLLRVLREEQDAAIVAPKLIYPFAPHLIQCAGVGISRSGRVQFRGRGMPRDAAEFNQRRECQCLISAALFFPRWLYEEIGGLDEAFNPIEFEDLDWCYRVRERGYRAFYEPSVEMHHWESITSEGTAVLPNTYLITKHGMLFKRRWRHMFENEDGPEDEDCRWVRIEVPSMGGGKRMR